MREKYEKETIMENLKECFRDLQLPVPVENTDEKSADNPLIVKSSIIQVRGYLRPPPSRETPTT